ncbi:MAG: ACT domain-containing protein [Burkholderiales bacterium]|nr:ACT domain-containing protein [Burkholderiales bacterium]
MALKVTRADVWTATVEDRVGGAAEKFEALARAKVNLEFALARRTPENPGKGILFAYPLKGAKAIRAAQEAGFAKSASIHSVRIEGPDKPGTAARIARALAEAGISFRGLAASALGRRFVGFVALDSAEDAKKAAAVLRKLA